MNKKFEGKALLSPPIHNRNAKQVGDNEDNSGESDVQAAGLFDRIVKLLTKPFSSSHNNDAVGLYERVAIFLNKSFGQDVPLDHLTFENTDLPDKYDTTNRESDGYWIGSSSTKQVESPKADDNTFLKLVPAPKSPSDSVVDVDNRIVDIGKRNLPDIMSHSDRVLSNNNTRRLLSNGWNEADIGPDYRGTYVTSSSYSLTGNSIEMTALTGGEYLTQ